MVKSTKAVIFWSSHCWFFPVYDLPREGQILISAVQVLFIYARPFGGLTEKKVNMSLVEKCVFLKKILPNDIFSYREYL